MRDEGDCLPAPQANVARTMRAAASHGRKLSLHEPHHAITSMVMSSRISQAPVRFRSKTITALLAFLLGSVGAHRFYLYGWRDGFGWAHLIGTALGIPGVLLLIASERASALGWALVMPGAASVLAAFLGAIVYGLRPDQKWDAQFNAGQSSRSQSGWGVIFVVIFSLLIGAFLLMSGLAVTFQTYFESQSSVINSLSR